MARVFSLYFVSLALLSSRKTTTNTPQTTKKTPTNKKKAANLLAHAPPGLFAAGVARSGAYNRTLTPFGFQSEERTLWQAPETYAKMSPFMNADKIKKPLLLVSEGHCLLG